MEHFTISLDDELKFIEPGRPMQNGFIERFNRSYREGVLSMYVFRTLEEVRERTESWLKAYTEELPQDALGDLTPVEYRAFPSQVYAQTRPHPILTPPH